MDGPPFRTRSVLNDVAPASFLNGPAREFRGPTKKAVDEAAFSGDLNGLMSMQTISFAWRWWWDIPSSGGARASMVKRI
ncbi:hypothetical protein [Sphingosinicella sp. BN140058]|uniref:hypothetical protein n=1 Tax=Sphingosinicella sp. BN140058 TaxID=1892855 RepID=UPI0010125EB0|nr:hypothetical protein [Sphingosinicella sp. BN140058]QAY76169.1 hypothetical protein ETR14_06225 [Sphingosinicella sp. BN140058]